MDVLSDILSSMRLAGGVVFDAEFGAPWCIVSQYGPDDCAAFFPVPAHVIAYHYVREGRFQVQVPGQAPVPVEAGEIILLPRNERHLMFSEEGVEPISIEKTSDMQAGDGGPLRFRWDGGGERTTMFCGYLGSTSPEHALLQSLPSLMKVKLDDARGEWLARSMKFAAEELRAEPSPEMAARLAELLFGEAVRRYIEDLPEGEGGWLAGLRDPHVAKALGLIHSRYAEAWDVNSLAREVGMSRSALAERFTSLIGEPPMRYCARWRMRMAANLLRDGRQTSGNVAYEVGFNSEAAFVRAFKREYGEPPATWKKRHAAAMAELIAKPPAEPALPLQEVRYCSASDGTTLAYSVVGEGPPIVKTANWLNHIEFDWDSPLWRHWLRELTTNHQLIRYDERGNGLSDWDTPQLSFDAFVDDLESVVDTVGLDRFDLLGISQGAAVAVAYAVRHPGRVRRMVLHGGYAMGWAVRADADESARRSAMMTLTKTGWGQDNPAFRQMFTSLYIPGGTPEQASWFNDMQRLSASPENAVRLQRVFSTIDVRALLPKVAVPTLVLHARHDAAIPFAAGEGMAARIPGARFVALESNNHLLLQDEPAWAVFVREVRAFLAEEDMLRSAEAGAPKLEAALSR